MPIRMPVVNGTAAAAGVLEHPQPDRGVLVRAAEVRPALLGEQPGRGGLQHHAHRRRDRLEPLEVLPGQHARVEVRQQAGLLQHPDRHGPDVGQRVVVAVRVQPFPGLRPAVLGPVAQGEQRLLAAQRRPLGGDLEHLVRGQVRAVQPARHGDERAVAAAVAAQPGQRDEHLARVGDDAGPPGRGQPGVPDPGRVAEQLGELRRRARAAGRWPRPGRGSCRPGPGPARGARAVSPGTARALVIAHTGQPRRWARRGRSPAARPRRGPNGRSERAVVPAPASGGRGGAGGRRSARPAGSPGTGGRRRGRAVPACRRRPPSGRPAPSRPRAGRL